MPVKPISPARMAANLANAQLSTGPKTIQGKARSRANALKHGLTGAGIALPTEDRIAIEQRFLTIQEELMPQTVLGAFFAHQVALYTVRCQRAARHETALLTTRINEAVTAFDQARLDLATQLFAKLYQNPLPLYDQLLTMPEGVDRIIGGLQRIRADLTRPSVTWSPAQTNSLAMLFGTNPATQPRAMALIFADVMLGNFAGIRADAWAHLKTDAERQAFGRDQLVAEIDERIEGLEAHRALLDVTAVDEERARVAEHAAFAASVEGAQARKYEAASTREIYRALREFAVVEADPAAERIGEPEEPAEPIDPNVLTGNDLQPTLGSFEPGSEPVAAVASLAPEPVLGSPQTSPQLGPDRVNLVSDLGDGVLPISVGRV